MKTYKDIYVFPLEVDDFGWVHDQSDNFVFQFVGPNNYDENSRQILLDAINGKSPIGLGNPVKHVNGEIQSFDGTPMILIRGWGGLTGIGGHNLSNEEAANIQDTFADFIVEQINNRNN